ncbi:unnamed protein product [Calicophoron daubneyi]|uniref:Elongation factor Ts, mitochondrial n=1 Tax=Calicophoron daubneyi TaxID=300641 RepID=A0AAV2U068_CALDB
MLLRSVGRAAVSLISKPISLPSGCYSSKASTSPLSKLRRATGYTFSACKDALAKHNNNYEEALKWLNEEAVRKGWDKAGRLSNRSLSEGLLGVMWNRTHAVILEVNCETDFVARNEQFQQFVATATESLMNEFVKGTALPKAQWTSDQLKNLDASNTSKLSDAAALVINAVGENMALRRAVGLYSDASGASRLATYTHMSMSGVGRGIRDVKFGKYAAAVRYRPAGDEVATPAWHERAARLGKQLCQHIVGMNPRPGLELTTPAEDPEQEDCLLLQPFFLDENVRVGEHLARNDMILEDFVRVECGGADEISEHLKKSSTDAQCK